VRPGRSARRDGHPRFLWTRFDVRRAVQQTMTRLVALSQEQGEDTTTCMDKCSENLFFCPVSCCFSCSEVCCTGLWPHLAGVCVSGDAARRPATGLRKNGRRRPARVRHERHEARTPRGLLALVADRRARKVNQPPRPFVRALSTRPPDIARSSSPRSCAWERIRTTRLSPCGGRSEDPTGYVATPSRFLRLSESSDS
jgi:hypothetical protein